MCNVLPIDLHTTHLLTYSPTTHFLTYYSLTNLRLDSLTNLLRIQALIVGVGSLSASTPYLAIILAAIIGESVSKLVVSSKYLAIVLAAIICTLGLAGSR